MQRWHNSLPSAIAGQTTRRISRCDEGISDGTHVVGFTYSITPGRSGEHQDQETTHPLRLKRH